MLDATNIIGTISRINLSFLCVFILMIVSIGYVIVCRLSGHRYKQHEFSVAETKPVRGLMALLIIVTHVSFKYPDDNLIMLFASFGAPVVSTFFFLSGYGLTISLMNKGNAYLKGFPRRSAKKLFIPFMVASIIWITLSCIFLYGNLSEELMGFITFNPPLPYSWFIYALILFYIIFYVASRLSKSLIVSSIIMIAGTLVVSTAFRILKFDPFWYICLFAFNAGNIYAVFHTQINRFIHKYPVLILAATLVVLITLDYFQIRTGMFALIPFGIVGTVLILGGGAKSRILNFLGSISYEIYLMHGIAIMFLANLGLNWGLYLLLACAITIPSAYLLHLICNQKSWKDLIKFTRTSGN